LSCTARWNKPDRRNVYPSEAGAESDPSIGVHSCVMLAGL
jgi:hypothetical protein